MIHLQSSSAADEHERQVQTQLHALEPWLLAEYGDRNCGSDHVRAVLTTPHDRFAAASVRTLLPILI